MCMRVFSSIFLDQTLDRKFEKNLGLDSPIDVNETKRTGEPGFR